MGDLFCVKQNYKTLQQIEDSGEIHLSNGYKKNLYLSEKWGENVTMYNLDVVIAKKHVLMTMADWKNVLTKFLELNDEPILPNAGRVTHEQAEEKALSEYERFRVIQDKEILSDFDRHCQLLFNEDM